jgi:general secretion pathway protein D
MKKLTLPKTLLVLLVAPAMLALVLPAGRLMAQSQTETKIRLMADALRARDGGDLDTAKKDLEELLALAPNDATVQRLLSGVNTSLEAKASTAAPAVAETSPPAPAEPVEVTFPKPVAPAPKPVVQTPEQAAATQADVLAKQENARIKGLIQDASAKRAEARRFAKDGRFDDAAAVLDAAAKPLPANPATNSTLAAIQSDKNALLLEKSNYLLNQGDTAGAHAAVDAYRAASANTKKADEISRKINSVELAPPMPSIDPKSKFIADQKEIAKLVAKGRSQYLAADSDGAQESFRLVESIDPTNPEAKSMLTRIANEKAQVGALNRIKTRAQMVEEVTNAWQRPSVYVDRGVDAAGNNGGSTPLAQKLNSIQIPSVNFQGVELSKVVSTLTAISEEYDKSEGAKGVNIVLIDPSNKNPAVSITLRNLSLNKILDFITQATGYQYEIQNDAVVVRPGGETTTLDTAFFPVTRSTVIRMTGVGAAAATTPAAAADPFAAAPAAGASGGSGGGTGDAASLRAFLQQAGVNFEGTPGSSLAYDGAAIIVTQSTRNIERIRNILNRYNDVRQVEIEAKFMEVQDGALDELGVNWTAKQLNGSNRSLTTQNQSLAAAFAANSTGSSGSIVQKPNLLGFVGGVAIYDAPSSTTTTIANNAPSIPGSANIGTGLGDLIKGTKIFGEFEVNATIRALSQKSGTDLLSAPKVTVLSGNPANIVVAQEMRYPQSYGEVQSQVGTSSTTGGGAGVTITAGTPQEFTMRNVGVELKVTPTVEDDDYSISLDLNPKVTEFEGFVEYGGQSVAISGGTTVTVPSGFYQPIFSTREVTTKVTVWDGATLVMGGLTREEVKKTNSKVPILGDIPFIGRAFRSKGESSQKRNLLIFVTANLVSPGGSPKKQQLKSVAPASMFQNPTIVTPGSAESRVRGGK